LVSDIGGKVLLESDIQQRLIEEARKRGVYVRKMVAMAYRGFPDLLLVRGGKIVFWEVKTLRGTVSVVQEREHRELQVRGARVMTTYGLWDALESLDMIFPWC